MAIAALVTQVGAEAVDVSAELAKFTQDGKIPALAAAAILDGKIVAAGATGVRKAGDKTPVTVNDKFHIGSCTKSMTGTLAAMLVADGKIQWSTTVGEVFPDLAMDEDYKKATLLQMASNSGGVPHDVPPALWLKTVADRGKPEAEQRTSLVKALLGVAPEYAPGTKRVYSNGGFTIAGAMLEKVTGKPYEKLLRERLFKPVEMETAGFGAAGTERKVDQPWGHVLRDGVPVGIPPGPDADNPPAITPAGRVHLSILDLAKYASFHAGMTSGKGPLGQRLPLDAGALKFLHTPVPPGKDYAVGWVTLDRKWAGGPAIMHNGTNTMNYAVLWIAPDKKFAAVAACNIDGGGLGAKACDEAVAWLIGEWVK